MKRLLVYIVLFTSLVESFMAQRLPNLIPYREGERWGFCDSNKKVLIKPQWERVQRFSNGLAAVEYGNKCGYIDTLGAAIIPLEYENGIDFQNGYALVVIDSNHLRVINKMNSTIIELKGGGEFDLDYSNETLLVYTLEESGKKWPHWAMRHYLYNTKGESLISIKCANILRTSSSNYYIISKGDYHEELFGVFDIQTKKEVVPITFNSDTNLVFKKKLDSLGIKRVIEEEKYCSTGVTPDFYCGKYHIKMGEHYRFGILDSLNNNITDYIYSSVRCAMNDKLFFVEKDDLWGVINNQGHTIVPLQFESIDSDCTGLYGAFIEIDYSLYLVGYIDSHGTKYWKE